MNVKYDPSDLVQVYFKALQDARTILVSLQENVADKVLIRQGIDQFNKHMDLNDAVDEWKNKDAADKTWRAFKSHFSKAVTKNQKRGGTLREIGIANQVKAQVDTNRDNTETVAQFQIEQAQTIEALTARLNSLEGATGQAYSAQGPPSITLTETSDDISQLTSLFQAYMTAQVKPHDAATSEGSTRAPKGKGSRQWTNNDNDLPNGQRSKRRHPDSNSYCFFCGYDLPPKLNKLKCQRVPATPTACPRAKRRRFWRA
jgi:hypothetical protein